LATIKNPGNRSGGQKPEKGEGEREITEDEKNKKRHNGIEKKGVQKLRDNIAFGWRVNFTGPRKTQPKRSHKTRKRERTRMTVTK